MSERSKTISKLLGSQKSRAAYIKAKLAVLVPAQIRALRLKSEEPPMPFQRDLAREAELHQSRISMFETPGMSNMTLETLAKVGAGLRCGVIVRFVPLLLTGRASLMCPRLRISSGESMTLDEIVTELI